MKHVQAVQMLRVSAREIADEVGVTPKTVRRWERGGAIQKKHRVRLGAFCKARALLLKGYGESLLED